MMKLVLVLLLVVVAMVAFALFRAYRRKERRQRHRAKEQAYVDRLRSRWDEKHSEPAEKFVERRRPWDGVERRKPRPPGAN